MSKLIVVCGIPASGKSTIADALAKRLNLFLLRKDSLIDGIMKAAKVKEFEQYQELNKIPVPLMFDLAEEQISLGVDFIMESAFCFPEDAEIFRNWIKKYDLDFHCIICSVDEETRKGRFESRIEHYEKYFIDEKIKNGSPVTFTRCDFDYGIMPGNKIYLKTSEAVEGLVDEVVAKIS